VADLLAPEPLTADEERAIVSLPPDEQEWVRSLSAADRRYLWLPGYTSTISQTGEVLDAPHAPLDGEPLEPTDPPGWPDAEVPPPDFENWVGGERGKPRG
jgi:hypothetical protein